MKYYNFLLFSLLLLLLFSCSQSHQYDVYVKNDTSGDLTIAYKSDKDKTGLVEKTIVLSPDERKKIISTVNYESDPPTSDTTADDCSIVAEYVRATNASGSNSKLEWCSDRVGFQVVDIGQGEFTLRYTNADF